MSTKSKRRRYQFSLRTMFVAVTLISIPLAWVGYQLNWIRQRRAILESGAIFGYPRCEHLNPYGYGNGTETEAPGELGMFGEKGHDYIFVLERDKVSEFHVRKSFPEAVVVELWEGASSPK